MDLAQNPFSASAGNNPPKLAGRKAILEDARVMLQRVKDGRSEQSRMLVGLRGVGKTVLLNEIATMAEAVGYRTLFVELPERRRSKPLAKLLLIPLRKILFELDRGERISEKTRKALRVFRSFIGRVGIKSGDFEYYVDAEPEKGHADSGDLESDLADLFIAVGEAAKDRARPVCILVDELQNARDEELSALIMAMHRVSQKALPLVLLGAGLPILRANAGNAKSYSERLFAFHDVDRLKKADADIALQEPAQTKGVMFTEEALEEIYKSTRGYPYFIQEWGKHSWNLAQGNRITAEDAKNATRPALENLDRTLFRVRFERLTPTEKKYVRAMAELGAQPQRAGDIAKLLGKPVNKVGPLKAQLISKGMIYSPAHGDTAFTVPLFEEFLMREIPTFSAQDEY